jgi:NADH-quinone oxidoreductase subunit K
MEVTITHYLTLSLAVFTVGLVGVLVRRNAIVVLMSLELMLNAANLNFLAFARHLNDITGQVFAVFVICIAAGEVAVGLALLIALYRNKETVDVSALNVLKW